jgi:hypothetical protein
MNIAIQLDGQRPLGPFLRTSDRMRLEGCVNALTREGLCLSLHCAHEVLLDHYVRLLLTRLREDSESHQIEVYFPANTESLLERFNHALSNHSISDATRHSSGAQDVRVWVVHDAQKVSESELQLLARLIHNFPGSRIRALLLFHGSASEPQVLEAFGRKLLRWEIDLPTEVQAVDALELAQTEGRHTQVAQLLRRIGCLPQAEPTSPLSLGLEAQQQQREEVARIKSPVAEKKTKWQRCADVARLMMQSLYQAPSGLKAFKSNWRWSLDPTMKRLAVGTALAFVLSLSIMAWMQPQSFVGKKTPASSPAAAPESPVRTEPALDSKPKSHGPVGLIRAHLSVKP